MSELTRLLGEVPAKWLVPLWLGATSRLVFGALFFIAGLRLKQALLTGARWIQRVLMIAGVVLVIELLWTLAVFGLEIAAAYQVGAAVGGLFGLGLRIAIVLYLYASVRRLSKEARVRAAEISFE
ncbi:MAG TPA: hypothetical protein VHW23_00705 [Kofleriaceae bacterium]|nr:hypothetical protein [Kofleriaceae bacterium]